MSGAPQGTRERPLRSAQQMPRSREAVIPTKSAVSPPRAGHIRPRPRPLHPCHEFVSCRRFPRAQRASQQAAAGPGSAHHRPGRRPRRHVALNHEDTPNGLSHALMDQLMTGLDRLVNEGVNVIVLRANKGVKVWSASHGINELPEPRRDPLSYGDPQSLRQRRLRRGHQVLQGDAPAGHQRQVSPPPPQVGRARRAGRAQHRVMPEACDAYSSDDLARSRQTTTERRPCLSGT